MDEDKLLVLFQELRNKNILDQDMFEHFTALASEDEGRARAGLLGTLDAQVHGNKITAETAEAYIKKLGLTAEQMDRMRISHRSNQKKKRPLN